MSKIYFVAHETGAHNEVRLLELTKAVETPTELAKPTRRPGIEEMLVKSVLSDRNCELGTYVLPGLYERPPTEDLHSKRFMVSFLLGLPERMELVGERTADWAWFDQSRAEWLLASTRELDFQDPTDHEAFSGQIRHVLEALGLSFGFAHNASGLNRNLETDPREIVWPVNVWSKARVEELGEDRVRSLPDAVISELPHGPWWVQKGPTPLAEAKPNMRAWAKHLGLRPPK